MASTRNGRPSKKKATRPRVTAGGSATVVGIDFQSRVAAWVACQILAEHETSPLWELPAATRLELLRLETEQPVDDLLVGTTDGGNVFIQVKHSLNLSLSSDSELASVLYQFVRQYLAYNRRPAGSQPWERELDPWRDRLVLIAGSNTPATIREGVPALLKRVRALAPTQTTKQAPSSDQQRETLKIVKRHVVRAWGNTVGESPTEEDLHHLLSLVYFQELDLADGERDEVIARNILRTSVLEDPNQAELAWNTLIQACAKLAQVRGGTGRKYLQHALISAGIRLKSPPSYRGDIDSLRRHTSYTIGLLNALSNIEYVTGAVPIAVKVNRPSTHALREAVEEASLVVVGEPGAGKSGALHDLAKKLDSENKDVILLAVEQLSADSVSELQIELGLHHRLDEVLENWPGSEPGFLVIDALDAARSEGSAKALRDLIRTVGIPDSRWRIVASIRKYDLRYNQDFQQQFLGSPPTEYRDSEFNTVRHINIPGLTDEELQQISSQSAALWNVVQRGDSAFRELIAIPFNLRLVAALVASGVPTHELAPIRTQLELLDRYWLERVIRNDGQGDARETFLREVAETMVQARSLRVARARIATIMASATLDDLLRHGVLSEWQTSPDATPDRETLSFSHHVLFDYAIARLLFRRTPSALAERLSHEPDLVLAIRPSLSFHFQHLWWRTSSRTGFWEETFRILQTEGIPEVAKLIGPSVAADLVQTISDLSPILEYLDSSETQLREVAVRTLRHLIGAILVAGEISKRKLVGSEAGPWCQLGVRITEHIDERTAYLTRSLIVTLSEKPTEVTAEQRMQLGLAARRLLEFAWQQEQAHWDYWLINHALRSVCRTFESDPAVSSALLHRALEPAHLKQHGFEELQVITREILRLILLDPQLVRDIYIATYSYWETSDAPTLVSGSRILPLVSNQRQDYNMARYALGEAFWDFITQAPIQATEALISAVEQHVAEKEQTNNIPEERFEFDEKEARYQTDYSAIWDYGEETHGGYEATTLLRLFTRYLDETATSGEKIPVCQAIIQRVIEQNRTAAIWRRLLISGAKLPNTLGLELCPLAWSVPILVGYDTSDAAGNYAAAVYPYLAEVERERVERTILALPDSLPEKDKSSLERIRDRLLGNLPFTLLVTDEAKQLVEQLQLTGNIRPNIPPFSMGEVEWVKTTDKDHLKEQGVPLETQSNLRVKELVVPVQEFAQAHRNSAPSLENAEAIQPQLKSLRAALSTAEADGVHLALQSWAWGHLVEACETVARLDSLPCDSELGQFVYQVLLDASSHPDPAPSAEADSQFDKFPSWGSPAARVDAAAGIILLARNPSCLTDELCQAIERLSGDPVPAVRFQIALRLNVLYRVAPDLMWSLLERFSQGDVSRGVVGALFREPLWRLARVEPEQVLDLMDGIRSRLASEEARDIREVHTSIVLGLYLTQNNDRAGNRVLEIANAPTRFTDEAGRMFLELRDWLRPHPDSPSEPAVFAKQRALEIFKQLVHSTCAAVIRFQFDHRDKSLLLTPEEVEHVKRLNGLAEQASMQIYFASGAFAEKDNAGKHGKPLNHDEKRQFFASLASSMLELADLAIPGVTHHLVETLEALVPAAPVDVFLALGRVIRAGKPGGYQFESLAVNSIVQIVERYLAEYRTVLRQNPECQRVLLEILDIFVDAGWPSAWRLTYRLEEIYR